MTATLTPTLRRAGSGDTEILYQIYASTRREELAAIGWDEPTKAAFLRMQFDAQHNYYRATYPDASYDLIVAGENILGRLYVHRDSDGLLIIDLTLLSEHRGRGIGTALLHRVIDEATVTGNPVRVHAERFNPACRLYARLGFRQIEDQGVYLLLERAVYPNTAS
jgi:GNAT superfamily N-acetyltransferase